MYEKQILRILLDVGERGISVKKLAKHVYNHYCTFFFQPDFQEIHRYTQRYLLSHSRTPNAIIEHTEKRGYYRLNTRNSKDARQLVLDFRHAANAEEPADEGKPAPDLSLSLFFQEEL